MHFFTIFLLHRSKKFTRPLYFIFINYGCEASLINKNKFRGGRYRQNYRGSLLVITILDILLIHTTTYYAYSSVSYNLLYKLENLSCSQMCGYRLSIKSNALFSNGQRRMFHLTSPNKMAASVKVSTTLPREVSHLPAAGLTIHTQRLIIRPLVYSDLKSYRSLRVQNEAMEASFGGKDENI